MRTTPFLISILGATLISVGVVSAYAVENDFYDPSNAASPTGKTIGHELFGTIGCPGRELLGKPCPIPAPEPVAAAQPEPAPVAAVTEPASAPLAAAAEPARAAPLVLDGVKFDFDKADIRPEDHAKLDRDVANLKEWGDVKVEVAGHTCSIGTDDYNLGLSQRRAESVRNYLIDKGIPADRLTARGYGESQPVAANATDEGRIENRRVELAPLK
jgi:outer membrane protein OmpA-like peptidoglycan-associated protein